MNENFESALIFLVVIGVGILAIRLPYRFNPFRLKRSVASLLSENAQMKVPKVFGWVLISVGGVGLLALALMFTVNAMQTRATKAEQNRVTRDSRMSEEAIAQNVNEFIQGSDDFELLVLDAKDGKYKKVPVEERAKALVRLKEAFGGGSIVPRSDVSSALFFQTSTVFAFKRNNQLTGEIHLAANLSAFNAVVPDRDEMFQSRAHPELTEKLIGVLPQLDRSGKQAVPSGGDQSTN